MFSLTVVAMTGKRFSGFAPYVASVNDAGRVAFQAALRGGGSAVFAGDGGEVEELVSRSLHAGVTSHPDLNNARDASFYGEVTRGGPGNHGLTLAAWPSPVVLGPVVETSHLHRHAAKGAVKVTSRGMSGRARPRSASGGT